MISVQFNPRCDSVIDIGLLNPKMAAICVQYWLFYVPPATEGVIRHALAAFFDQLPV